MRDIKLDIDKSIILILLCAYREMLVMLYQRGITAIYVSQFSYVVNFKTNIGVWLLYIALAYILVFCFDNTGVKVSSVTIWILFLMNYAPFSVLTSFDKIDPAFLIANNAYWLFLIGFYAFFCKGIMTNGLKFVVNTDGRSYMIVNLIGFACIFAVIFISARYTHFRLNFNLLNVYDLRFEARGFNIPTALNYIFCWSRTIIPFMFCYHFTNNNYKKAAIYFAVQILSFGIDGMKTTLFVIVLDFGILLFLKIIEVKNYYNFVLFGITSISFVALLELIIHKTSWLLYLIFYRMEFLPVKISGYFYDFFTTHQPDYFRSSFLRRFGFTSPYNEYGINRMISGIYGGQYESTANNGLISDAITNLGLPGIIIMPLLIILFLVLFDCCTKTLDNRLNLILGVQIALILSNTFLFVALLTNGLAVLLFMTFIINQFSEKQEIQTEPILLRGNIRYESSNYCRS